MLPGTFEIIKFEIIVRNKTKFEHVKEHIISKVLNVQVEYFQFEYFFAFLKSINIKTMCLPMSFSSITIIESFLKRLCRIN